MKMHRVMVMLLFVVVMVLAGCNSGISSDAAAKAFINGLYGGNAAGARDALCTAAKSMLTDEMVAALAQTPVDTSGLSYSVRDATDTTANVAVSGNVKVGAAGAQQDIDFATFGAPFTLLPAVVEDSAWKICPASLNFPTP